MGKGKTRVGAKNKRAGASMTRASTAAVMGACVFAVSSGAGAVFVGDWWGQHHGPVVIQFVSGPGSTSRAATSHAAAVQKTAQTLAPTSPASPAYLAEPDSATSPAAPTTWTSPAEPHHTVRPRSSAHGTPSASPTPSATTPSVTPSTTPSTPPTATPTITVTPTSSALPSDPTPPPSISSYALSLPRP